MADDDLTEASIPTEPEETSIPPLKNPPDPQDVFASIYSYVKEHPAIIGPLIYLQVSAVGIAYIWTLLSRFSVNVFDYAESNDFLLAAFKQPLALGMGLLTCILLVAEILNIRYRKRKKRKPFRKPLRFLGIIIAVILIYTFLPALLLGSCDARKIKEGKSGLVSLKLKGKLGEVDSLLPKGKLSIIGSTDKFLFFYGHDINKCIVVPISNIGSLSIDVGKGKEKGHILKIKYRQTHLPFWI